MKIRITKEQKIELLKAIQTGVLDTDQIFPELYKNEAARILTKEEVKEFIEDIEKYC